MGGKETRQTERGGRTKIEMKQERNRKTRRNRLHLELSLPSSAAPGISLGSILGLSDGRLH